MTEDTVVALIAGLCLRPVTDLDDFVDNHIHFYASDHQGESPETWAQAAFKQQFRRYLQLPGHPDSIDGEDLVGARRFEDQKGDKTLRARLLLSALYEEEILPADPEWSIGVCIFRLTNSL
jgi:hypothetical protein